MERELPYAASVEAQYLAAVLEELEGLRADIASALAPASQPAKVPGPAPATVVELREPAPALVDNPQESAPEAKPASSSPPKLATAPARKPAPKARKR